MTTTIGTVTLTSDMVWNDEYKWNPLFASAFDTIGGGRIVQEFLKPTEKGRPITLESLDQQGYQEKSTVEALKTLATQVGTVHTLTITHSGMTLGKQVRFRNEVDGGAVQFEQVPLLNGLRSPEAWYAGVIYLECI